MSIETFTNSIPGRLVVSLLKLIIGIITLYKYGEGKTALDTPKGTIIAGLILLAMLIVAIRIVAEVS
ncbi:hypothetical protein M1O29_00585 [Dehalococcoidia bacterium]|nr:hypothetical protein [Dehalococcoidia bacterium]